MGSRPDTHPSADGPVVRVALFLCMGIVLSGCGGGDGAAPTAAPPSTPPTPPPPPAPQPPNPPANLRVSAAGEDFVEWSWNAVEGATGYEVQFRLDGEFTDAGEVIDTSSQTVYRRGALPAGTSAFLRVRAYAVVGDLRLRSGWTVALPATTLAPTVVSLEVSGTGILTSIGETAQFMVTATLSDGSMQAVEAAEADWESSDPAVATVSEGLLTAAGGGNATITVTFGGQSAEVPVSVRISTRTAGTVRVLYVSPADRQFRADYSEGITNAIVDLQSWYRRQTGGLTFSLYESTPEHCRLPEPEDYYVREGDAWPKVQEDVQPCAPVENGRSSFVWVVYTDLSEMCDDHGFGVGWNGIASMARTDLVGLAQAGTRYHCGYTLDDPLSRWIGGTGHEVAHALANLRHPPGCDEGLPSCDPVSSSLMAYGYTTYPDTYLTVEDKETLLRSPFIAGEPAPDREALGALGGSRVRGTVRGPGGVSLEGIRISVWGDAVWNWGETTADGTFDVGMPAGASDSAVISVHGGKAADCRWLGYHGEGELIGLRENATRVAIGAADVTGIEIRLPGDPDALCGGQRTLSGRVLGPDGRPVAEVFVGFSDEWILTGRDGTFVIRGPQGLREGVGIAVPECGYVGSYGPGGFTTVESESWWVELGATDVTGMEIRLPASPAELCRRQPAVLEVPGLR